MESKKKKVDYHKIIIIICAVVFIIFDIFLVVSLIYCNVHYSIKEDKYYMYMFDNEKKDSPIWLVSLTDKGAKERFLFIPSEIDGHNVMGFKNGRILSGNFNWKSSVCEKIYIQKNIATHYAGFNYVMNLKKVFVIDIGIPNEKTLKYSYNYYVSKINYDAVKESEYKIKEKLLPANISYNYNYEDSENYGVYFIDDCDYGSKIEYIPANPTREGYIFDGWYKEPECINKWNYESDTLPEEIKEVNENNEEEVKFQETKLYAKWNKQ